MDTRKTLLELAAREFKCDPDKLSTDTPIKELGIDSLAMLEFVFRVEEVFDIRIENEQAEKLVTLTDVVTLVEQLRAPVAE